MSWLSKQLKSAKKAVTHPASWIKGAGKTVGKAADNPLVKTAGALALGATGVGAPMAAAIMAGSTAGSKVLQGKSLPKALPGIAMDAAMSMAMAKGGSMLRGAASKVPLVNRMPFANPGIKLPANVDVGKIFSGLPTDAAGNIMKSSGGTSTASLMSRFGNVLKGAPSITPHSGSGRSPLSSLRVGGTNGANKSLLGKAVSFGGSLIKGGGADGKGKFGAAGDLAGQLLGGDGGAGGGEGGAGMSLLDKLLMGGGVAVSAMDAKRKRDIEDEAMDFSRDSYNSRAPLRARAMALLGDESTPDRSALFEDKGNPYSRPTIAPAAPMRIGRGATDATAGPRRLPSAAEPLMLPRMKDPALLAQPQ